MRRPARSSAAVAALLVMVVAGSLLPGGSAQGAQPPGTLGRIVVSTGAGLVTMTLGGDRTAVAGTTGAETDPEWAPNGTFLVFDVGMGIVRSAPNGSARTTLFAGGANPAVSPDSARVVFECPGLGGICTIAADGTGGVSILPGTAGGAYPDFTPDGSQIVFNTGAGLFRTPAAGGPVTAIAGGAAGDEHPRVTPNGAFVLFNTGGAVGGFITRLPFPAGGARLVLPGQAPGSTNRHPHPFPDGLTVLFDVGGAGGLGTLVLPGGGGLGTPASSMPGDFDPSVGRAPAPPPPPPPPPPAGSVAPVFLAPASNATVLVPVFGAVAASATVNVVASDGDAGQRVTLSASGLPGWATFSSAAGNPASGTISARPSLIEWVLAQFNPVWPGFDAPTATVTLRATDNGTPVRSSTRTVTLRMVLFVGSAV